jgi:hypothetical protein
MKKLLGALLSLTLVFTASPATAVDDWLPVEPANPPGFNYEKDSMGRNGITHFLIDEVGLHNQSLVYYRTNSGGWLDCNAATADLDCGSGKKGEIQGNAMLPVCGTEIESCIEKVWVYEKNSPEAGNLREFLLKVFQLDLQSPSGLRIYSTRVEMEITQ